MDFGNNLSTLLNLLGAFIFVFVILGIVSYIVNGLAFSSVAKVEGKEKEGLLAWIPIFNNVLFINLGNGNYLVLLLLFFSWIPIVGMFLSIAYSIYMIVMEYRIFSRYNLKELFMVNMGLCIAGVLAMCIGIVAHAVFTIGLILLAISCILSIVLRVKLLNNSKNSNHYNDCDCGCC